MDESLRPRGSEAERSEEAGCLYQKRRFQVPKDNTVEKQAVRSPMNTNATRGRARVLHSARGV